MKFFLCVPFTSRVNDAGAVQSEYRTHLEELTNYIKSKGHQYYLALEYAGWIMGGHTDPEDELRHDFEQIDDSEIVIALLEERVSAGVQLENGYAYAKNKKVYIYQIGKPAWSNIAFATIAGHDIKTVADDSEFINQAKLLVEHLSLRST